LPVRLFLYLYLYISLFMKKHLLCLALSGCFVMLQAQDQLFRNDNSKLLVKITEISPDEIKYRLYDHLTGPVYVLQKKEVAMIIYENGNHEVFRSAATPDGRTMRATPPPAYRMSREDSSRYYRYQNSISLNFFNFFNNEVGLIYQREFYNNNFSLVIPLAVGLEKASLTDAVYFSGRNEVRLSNKLFEAGIGFNYYPTLRFPVNYYIGPALRYMQYNCQQVYSYVDPNAYPYSQTTITRNGTLSRYCMSVTNGVILRTKSRLVINVFGSLGFKNDIVDSEIINPVNQQPVRPYTQPLNLYFWSGFTIGYGF
jgi:hypothetical protein